MTLRNNLGHTMKFTRSTLYFLVFLALGTPAVHAQLNDYLQSLKRTSDPEQREETLNSIFWSDKLINEMVSAKVADPVDAENLAAMMNKAIVYLESENKNLDVLIRAITEVDPLIKRYIPQWIVKDEAMVIQILQRIRDARDEVTDAMALTIHNRIFSGKARVRVIRMPREDNQLLAVIVENALPHDEAGNAIGFVQNAQSPKYDDYRIVGELAISEVFGPLTEKLRDPSAYASIDETGYIKPKSFIAETAISIPFGGGFLWSLDAAEQEDVEIAMQAARVKVGLELKIGNDWINMPFLYGAQWNTLFVYQPSNYEVIKIGPSFPFSWGDKSIEENFGLFKHRKVTGTWGASAEYFKQLSDPQSNLTNRAYGIGAAAFVSFGLKTMGDKKVTNSFGEIINGQGAIRQDTTSLNPEEYVRRNVFNYVSASATAYYWQDLGVLLSGLRIAAGLGYVKMEQARRQFWYSDSHSSDIADRTAFEDTVKIVGGSGTLDLYAKLSYDHTGTSTYGASVQYFNGGLLGEAYFNIFSWLRAEVKYARVVFRDPEAWEHEEMIVPGLRIYFAF